jgi:hypothetical protein
MKKAATMKERFCALIEVLDGEDWGSRKIALILGCTVQQARFFCRNDLDFRRKTLEKFAQDKEKNSF